jgi:hypothetical protein
MSETEFSRRPNAQNRGALREFIDRGLRDANTSNCVTQLGLRARLRMVNRAHTPAPPVARSSRHNAQLVPTTTIYLHADMQQKERSIARVRPPATKLGRYRPGDAVLEALIDVQDGRQCPALARLDGEAHRVGQLLAIAGFGLQAVLPGRDTAALPHFDGHYPWAPVTRTPLAERAPALNGPQNPPRCRPGANASISNAMSRACRGDTGIGTPTHGSSRCNERGRERPSDAR